MRTNIVAGGIVYVFSAGKRLCRSKIAVLWISGDMVNCDPVVF